MASTALSHTGAYMPWGALAELPDFASDSF